MECEEDSGSNTRDGTDMDDAVHYLCCVKSKDPKSQREDLTIVKREWESL